jgi:hypothetical protein
MYGGSYRGMYGGMYSPIKTHLTRPNCPSTSTLLNHDHNYLSRPTQVDLPT